jgi:spore coat polysaccharide biosynthesis protein SpsF
MRVVAIVQARLGSTRLPGKVLRDLCSQPMITHVVERTLQIAGVNDVIVAIPDTATDDPLFAFLSTCPDIGVTRGSENDVLARYHLAAGEAGADVIVRITSDCPLLSPSVSGDVVKTYLDRWPDVDYASNTLRRTFPRGLDTEVFSLAALETAHREAESAADREHVTPFIWRQPERFDLLSIEGPEDKSSYRWTVDTEDDLELVTRIYGALYAENPIFEYQEILRCLDKHPDWVAINRNVQQKSV